VNALLPWFCVYLTKREQTKRSFFSRGLQRRTPPAIAAASSADRADFVAGSIFLFENRDPDGDLLDGKPTMLSETEQAGRFATKFSRRLRGLFHDLKTENLVTDDDLPLFYWPQTAESRIRLALRLRQLAMTARTRERAPAVLVEPPVHLAGVIMIGAEPGPSLVRLTVYR
jgi:hypothetical protein